MIKSILIALLSISVLILLFYDKRLNISKLNQPIVRKITGFLSIGVVVALTLKFIKVMPLFLKLSIFAIDFLIIYLIFITLINKNK
jgi:UDP-N-acetylmuramyl pentapeptide phosphotransferase/UDP-N-acetylglucosamine-1-phosphate transferase